MFDGRAAIIDGARAGMRYALNVPREAMRGQSGAQLGTLAGSSVDFKDFRAYEPGDDLRRLDWGILARTDREVVKLYREEVSPHLDILLDNSASMANVSDAKARVSVALCAMLASAAQNAKCLYSLWLSGKCEARANPSVTMSPEEWAVPEFAGDDSPGDDVCMAPPAFRRNGIRIVVSDLLWAGEPEQFLRVCSANAASLAVARVIARADADPDVVGNAMLVDSETREELPLFVDDTTIRRYRDAYDKHREMWVGACRRFGAKYLEFVAEDDAGALGFRQLEEAAVVVTI